MSRGQVREALQTLVNATANGDGSESPETILALYVLDTLPLMQKEYSERLQVAIYAGAHRALFQSLNGK